MPSYERDVTARCDVKWTFILGPHFFDNVTSSGLQSCSITGARYKAILENCIISELHHRNVDNAIVWMQDDAYPYIAINVRQVLQQRFGDRIIVHNFAVSWPPCSPTLILMNLWFWNYLKSKVYA